jgi:hypothetical protein
MQLCITKVGLAAIGQKQSFRVGEYDALNKKYAFNIMKEF